MARSDSGQRAACVIGRQRVFTDDGSPLPRWLLVGGEPSAYGPSLVLAWRQTYDQVGPYDTSFSYGPDTDWLIRVRAAGLQVAVLEEVLTERRVHDANVTLGAVTTGDDRFVITRSLRKTLHSRSPTQGTE